MKQISPTLFILNDYEKQKILEVIKKKDKSAYLFYKSLFKYKRIPTFFIDDILILIDNNPSLKNIINNLKLINSTTNISKIIDIDQDCYSILRDFQKKSFEKLNQLLSLSGYFRGLLIADDPGLGKTLTSLCIAKSYYTSNNIDIDDVNLVIVVPLTLITNWIKAVQSVFDTYNLRISSNPNSPDANVFVINYEKLDKINVSNYILIVDEAHNFHNIESERYKNLFNKAINSELILLLTGTPIREGVLNLLSLYALIDYKLSDYSILLTLMKLLRKYYKYIYKILIKKFSRIMIRNKKEDIFDNVGEIDFKPITLHIDTFRFKKMRLSLDQINKRFSQAIDILSKVNELSKTNPFYRKAKKIIHKYLYDLPPQEIISILKDMKLKIDFDLIKKYIEILLFDTKQALNSKIWHSLLDDTLIFIIDNHIDDIKRLILSHNKTLIVSKSRKAVQHLYNKLTKIGINGINITANDSASERFDKIKEFETKSKYRFLISTYPIIEAGVNLPFVDLILLLDLPYRPHSLEQVINRTQRLENISDPIKVRYIKLDYPYNILEHHYRILKEVSVRVNNVIQLLEKEL